MLAESDSLQVINICSGHEQMWNEATTVYADCFAAAGLIGRVDFFIAIEFAI